MTKTDYDTERQLVHMRALESARLTEAQARPARDRPSGPGPEGSTVSKVRVGTGRSESSKSISCREKAGQL